MGEVNVSLESLVVYERETTSIEHYDAYKRVYLCVLWW